MKKKIYASILLALMLVNVFPFSVFASSHREAPLIANDPLADNTDLYAFRSPDDPEKITIIANYVPGQLPQGGPNYYSFGKNIRYEIHIDNNMKTKGDDIVYRFTFDQENQDPTTFFNIRLGKQNLKTTYRLERSLDGGSSFQTIVQKGIVPPPNIGPRSISSQVGLGAADYKTLMKQAVTNASSGEKVFCGTADDPFFVDLGGIFDLGDAPRTTGTKSIDGLSCLNVSTIALQINISTLQKNGKSGAQAKNILDSDYIIGIWASASRQKIRTLEKGGKEMHSGEWVQVSRLGMPLTNEVIIPIGYKDFWNSLTPYQDITIGPFRNFFFNPELALYMDDALFGGAVPALSPLRIQKNSLGAFGFGNTQDGLFKLKGSPALAGTALDDALFGKALLPGPKSPRSVDIWPIFNTGIPNAAPYQLATGKQGNPLAAGKPWVNNFIPTSADMLRLNMAVPPTPRSDSKFSNLGLVQAAVLGLTDPAYNGSIKMQFIPNMDGFPNGRRLEDDVVRIELQAVGGIALAAIGLWYDDFNGSNPVTKDLLDVLTYSAGVTSNDAKINSTFPYVAEPWPGTHNCNCGSENGLSSVDPDYSSMKITDAAISNDALNKAKSLQRSSTLGVATPEVMLSSYPNPVNGVSTIKYSVDAASHIRVAVFDATGRLVKILVDKKTEKGVYTVQWNAAGYPKGNYMINATKDGAVKQTIGVVKN